jgi:hypothetical protein
MAGMVPVPPVAAFIVGFVLYYALASAGVKSATLAMPDAAQTASDQNAASATPAEA